SPTSEVNSKFSGRLALQHKGLNILGKGDPMPENLEERAGFEKTFDVAKLMYPGNTWFANLHKRYLESLRYQREENEGTSRACMHTEDQTRTDERQKASSEAATDEFPDRLS
ncbi:hypothetical protein Tco_1061962, partial [Tanacetum coccineum]